ncbi:MAG: glycosyltransferase [Chloroflexota bacterium]|nr:glycosyltransferase [Chloroflexota bacterium]
MTRPKRILIFVADLGFGHRAAARALESALSEVFGDKVIIETTNPMTSELAPSFLRNTTEDYDRFVRELPDLYQITYQVSGTSVVSSLYEGAYTVMLLLAVQNVVDKFKPDVIVVAQENFLAPLNALMALRTQPIPVVTVLTDLTSLHRMWFNEVSTMTIVPTDVAYDLAVLAGLPKTAIMQIGIPVNTAISRETREQAVLRDELGWAHERTTLLVVGSKRVRQLMEVLRVFNHCGFPLQLAVVAGGDDELYEQLQATEWHHPAHIYNFVSNIPQMMHAADAIVCKAGGLIVSEALAAGMPILLTDVIEGQETGNADYVVTHGAGVRANEPIEALEAICHWLADDGKAMRLAANKAHQLGRPRAAYEIAHLIMKLAMATGRLSS